MDKVRLVMVVMMGELAGPFDNAYEKEEFVTINLKLIRKASTNDLLFQCASPFLSLYF